MKEPKTIKVDAILWPVLINTASMMDSGCTMRAPRIGIFLQARDLQKLTTETAASTFFHAITITAIL